MRMMNTTNRKKSLTVTQSSNNKLLMWWNQIPRVNIIAISQMVLQKMWQRKMRWTKKECKTLSRKEMRYLRRDGRHRQRMTCMGILKIWSRRSGTQKLIKRSLRCKWWENLSMARCKEARITKESLLSRKTVNKAVTVAVKEAMRILISLLIPINKMEPILTSKEKPVEKVKTESSYL